MSRFKKYFDNDHYQSGLRAVVICTLAAALTVGVNLLGGLLPTKLGNIDVSSDKVYSISRESEEALKALDKPVTLYHVCEAGSEYHNTEVVLNLYDDASERITVEKVDPAFDPTLVTRYAGDTALANNSVIVVCENRRQIVRFSDYYTSGSFVLEDFMNSAIAYVASDRLRIAYALTGHEEQPIHASTRAYMGLDGFALEELDLIKAGAVPEDAGLVIVNGIAGDITEKEAEALLAYLCCGGGLLLSTDYTTTPRKNLERVTAYFGAALGQGLVMESDAARYTDDNPAYLLPTIYSGDYTLTRGISYMLLPNTMPILFDEAASPETAYTNLLEASESSFSVRTNIFTGETGTQDGPWTVGASFEKGVDGGEGKLIWVTSKYLADVTVSEAAGGGNITFFLNSVCWLGEEDPVESVHAKKISTQYLDIPDGARKAWSVVLIGVVPLAALALGTAVCVRRKKRG